MLFAQELLTRLEKYVVDSSVKAGKSTLFISFYICH